MSTQQVQKMIAAKLKLWLILSIGILIPSPVAMPDHQRWWLHA